MGCTTEVEFPCRFGGALARCCSPLALITPSPLAWHPEGGPGWSSIKLSTELARKEKELSLRCGGHAAVKLLSSVSQNFRQSSVMWRITLLWHRLSLPSHLNNCETWQRLTLGVGGSWALEWQYPDQTVMSTASYDHPNPQLLSESVFIRPE